MRNIHKVCAEIEERIEELQYELGELYKEGLTDDDDEVKEILGAIKDCESNIDDLCEIYVIFFKLKKKTLQ